MARVCLWLVLVFLLNKQVCSQTGASVAYPATSFKGSEQVCPPDEQWEMARAEIQQDARDLIRTCILHLGQTQENPATSCLEISQCNSQLPSQFYWITSSNGTAIQIYCDMLRECSCNSSSAGGWSRVAYLNMTDPTHQCPPEWREITEPVRTCGRTNQTLGGGGCSSASFSTYNISYSHICGRIIGYQFGGPDAFLSTYNTGIEDPYVDGVVIVRGAVKHHVWTFAGEVSEAYMVYMGAGVCSCTHAPNPGPIIPPFVGEDYFCETGVTGNANANELYPDDPLWDGENCGSGNTCCEFNNPPYFCQSLPETTVDDIEVRICGDENLGNEDTPIELIEIFVQ